MKSGGPLRRTGPIERKKPLTSTTGLAPGGPLRRTGGLTRKAAALARDTPLPAKRATPRRRDRGGHVCCGEHEGKALVRERSGGTRDTYGPCEMCGERQAVQWSHRKAEGRGGCWCPSNGLASCHRCHLGDGGVHREPELADRNGWTVRTEHDPLEVPVRHAAWPGREVFLLVDGGLRLT